MPEKRPEGCHFCPTLLLRGQVLKPDYQYMEEQGPKFTLVPRVLDKDCGSLLVSFTLIGASFNEGAWLKLKEVKQLARISVDFKSFPFLER